jgi:hypothetical protein
VTAQFKACNVFARSNTGNVGSNPTRDKDVCVRLFCVCVVLCVGTGLATGSLPVQGVPQTLSKIHNCYINSDGKQARGPNTKGRKKKK